VRGTLHGKNNHSNGAYRPANPNGDTLMMLINDKFLKKYYPDHVNTIPLIKEVLYMITLILN